MFKIEGKNYNKYIKETELSIEFLPKPNENFILNDENVICDKIVILKHYGIVYYLRDVIVKFIDAKNILINYNDEHDLFKIIYNSDGKIIKNLDIDLTNKTTYIRYKDFSKLIKNLSRKENKILYEERNDNLDIGTVVIPKNIPFPTNLPYDIDIEQEDLDIINKNNTYIVEEYNTERGLSNYIHNTLVKNKDKILESNEFKENLIKEIKSKIKTSMEVYGYKIIEKTDLIINERPLYILESITTNAAIKEYELDENKILRNIYSDGMNFSTYEDYLEFINLVLKVFIYKK